MQHLLTLFDLSDIQVEEVLAIAGTIKAETKVGHREPRLLRKTIGLVFEKPSLRTRVSFEAGIRQLGGSALFLSDDVGFGKREPMKDFSEVLSRFVDAIVCRAKSHETVETLAKYSNCPIINGLTDSFHPCQALADLLTVKEHFGSLGNDRICYVGDANNVARSLVIACGKLRVPVTISCPKKYSFDDDFLARVKKEIPKLDLEIKEDPREAAQHAGVVYTDVWASMGQEAEQAEREKDFADYQVNADLMKEARPDAIFLHCLPAHRGLEVTSDVIDGPQSRVYEQAENRMHAQKGLLAWLIG